MEGHSHIATDVVARYARDAAAEVPGVTRVVEGVRKGVRVDGDAVELHLAVDWGASIPDVAAEVQRRVSSYLAKMADLQPARVDVVVEEVDGAA